MPFAKQVIARDLRSVNQAPKKSLMRIIASRCVGLSLALALGFDLLKPATFLELGSE